MLLCRQMASLLQERRKEERMGSVEVCATRQTILRGSHKQCVCMCGLCVCVCVLRARASTPSAGFECGVCVCGVCVRVTRERASERERVLKSAYMAANSGGAGKTRNARQPREVAGRNATKGVDGGSPSCLLKGMCRL
jgi:hypothetical protein